jgi:hypothetical protein
MFGRLSFGLNKQKIGFAKYFEEVRNDNFQILEHELL